MYWFRRAQVRHVQPQMTVLRVGQHTPILEIISAVLTETVATRSSMLNVLVGDPKDRAVKVS